MDVGEHTARGDGHCAQELAELFVVADCKLNVSGNNTGSPYFELAEDCTKWFGVTHFAYPA